MFDPQDEEGAINATRRLIEATAEREALRQNAVAEAEQWGWAAATRQLQQFYHQVLAESSLPLAA